MKQSSVRDAQNLPAPSVAPSRRPQTHQRGPGALSEVAALANQSPQVESLTGLSHAAGQWAGVHMLMGVASEINQTQPVQRKPGTAVVQREEEEEQKRDEPDAGGDLRKTTIALKALVKAGGETASEIQAYIEELEEIAESGDSGLQSLAMKSLDEQARANGGGSLEELVANGGGSEQGSHPEVIQGNFIYDWLVGMATYVASNPGTVAAVVAVLASALGKVRAERKREQLPLTPHAALFSASRVQYWAYLRRFVETYCKANQVTPKDQKNLADSMKAAIQHARNEDRFKSTEYSAEAAGRQWDNNSFTNSAFVDRQIFIPFAQGLGVVSSKSIQTANVEPQDRAGFSKSLKKIPFVTKVLEGKLQGNKGASVKKTRNKAKARGVWKTGASLKQKIREVDDGYAYLTSDRREVDNGNFAKKVEQADLTFRRTVEPEVLGKMPPPGVAVHLRNTQGATLPWGFRGFQDDGEIHVAQNASMRTIVHEIGHYVEDNLPMEEWADIQLLLHARQGGESKAGYIYPWTLEEQRFSGSYPATGAYTSKYYESGSTEVMSKSVETLVEPSKFKSLIEQDPQQAAIILRLLRPAEFNRHMGQSRYVQKYLPG